MLKIKPHSMSDGNITAINIIDENLDEIVEIIPTPFEMMMEATARATAYYSSKKRCENLIKQLTIAQTEFESAKNEFDRLMKPKQAPIIRYDKSIILPEPEPEKPPEILPIPPEGYGKFKPEPIIKSEPIVSVPATPPQSLEEITTSIIESDEFKSLIENNQLSDTTIRTVISKNTKPELVDTVHEMVITQLKEKGVIEPTFFEKVGSIVKKRGRKPKTEEK